MSEHGVGGRRERDLSGLFWVLLPTLLTRRHWWKNARYERGTRRQGSVIVGADDNGIIFLSVRPSISPPRRVVCRYVPLHHLADRSTTEAKGLDVTTDGPRAEWKWHICRRGGESSTRTLSHYYTFNSTWRVPISERFSTLNATIYRLD